ncbi:MAG: nucleotidyltransferase domain-containing protein [Candidatus Omnitrophica bacterium]|nr:nucleotidyltransferase domain-containing protein [Candidatus Omnitrophota bacterium]
MDKADVLILIKKFNNTLKSQGISAAKIILFGSWAKGTALEDSDIDLVVISDDFKGKDYWDRVNIISSAIYKIFAPFEVVALTTEEWKNGENSVCEYAKEGEVIFV